MLGRVMGGVKIHFIQEFIVDDTSLGKTKGLR